MKKILLLIIIIIAIAISIEICTAYQLQNDEKYPYHSKRFDALVEESFKEMKAGEPQQFYDYLDRQYFEYFHPHPGIVVKIQANVLLSAVQEKRTEYSKLKSLSAKTKFELENAKIIHKFIKKAIPKFDLCKGFEFCYVVQYGQRQCFLQSVLIASILQQEGMNAGVVMVYKNIAGEPSNNGHAVVLLKLSDGKDVIVDASDPIPFVTHKGLFARLSDYIYIEPVYAKKSYTIVKYKKASDKSYIAASCLKTMDYGFLRSQFYYYRGERVIGGVINNKKTKKGLQGSAKYLKKSISLCNGNPLSVYMLGRVYMNQGDNKKASDQFKKAYNLYSKYGWIPDGVKDVIGK
jgi:hypothetical protein